MTIISFFVTVYVIALLILIGAFYRYGVRSGGNASGADGAED